ncbi:hypothetical protein [Micromonospora auratinigra]|uniref:Uncharacterized protein n=1 Tax=Micromonospora auratinigra TaxID=261654 RepID=A0A1A8ZEB4_9ACTN|nr:hypothetical protein [Micromonospora auratinigra]SBT42222.1 hypothetical protein GA0070611_1902 [Micromonospora auratinigra]
MRWLLVLLVLAAIVLVWVGLGRGAFLAGRKARRHIEAGRQADGDGDPLR